MSVSPTMAKPNAGACNEMEPGEWPGVSMILNVMPANSSVSSCLRKWVAVGAMRFIS